MSERRIVSDKDVATFKSVWHHNKPGERVRSGLQAVFDAHVEPDEDVAERDENEGQQTLFEAVGIQDPTFEPVDRGDQS